MILVLLLEMVLLIICFILFFILLFQVIAIFTTDAPFVPVPKKIQKNIVDHLDLKAESILYDLGCGDARILLEATKKYPNIKAIGIEKALFPYLLAKFYTRKYKKRGYF